MTDNDKPSNTGESLEKKGGAGSIDPLNPPVGMSASQVAKWLNLGRKIFARNEASQQAAQEARIKAEADAAARAHTAELKAARIAAVRASAEETSPKKVSGGQVAAFLWMPQINLSLRGLALPLALLVQTFAQILAAVSLIPPDHPALTFSGAKKFRLFQLMEEAKINLPPAKLMWAGIKTNARDEAAAAARVFVTRQYVVFISAIGVLVSGSLTIIVGLMRVMFGVAHAYAQGAPTSGGGANSGTLAGINSMPANTDLASAYIDAIFGTGTGSSAPSAITKSLGAMLQFYSSTVLIFAGIIVLWIVISAVAETARTGVPFGKNFNHVWAPIRLIVALGLLVPLSSTGLNSGQWMILSLAKWGSAQATQVWSTFADSMVGTNGGGGGGTSTSTGIASLPLDLNSNQVFAQNLFQVLLCQAVNDTYNTNSKISTKTTTVGAMGSVQSVGPTGTTPTQLPPSATLPSTTAFTSSGGVNCGSYTVQVPNPASANSGSGCPGGANSSGCIQAAVGPTQQAIMSTQSTATQNLVTALTPLANEIAQDALKQVIPGGTDGWTLDQQAEYAKFQSAFTNNGSGGYMDQLQSSLKTALGTYNASLDQQLKQMAKVHGWIYSPIWLASIAAANGQVGDTSRLVPSVSTPIIVSEGAPFSDPTGKNMWIAAQNFVKTWEPSNVSALNSPTGKAGSFIQNALTNMTNDIGGNPLGRIGVYGQEFLEMGFKLILPPEVVKCYDNPGYDQPVTATNPNGTPSPCSFVLTDSGYSNDADGLKSYKNQTHLGGGGATVLPNPAVDQGLRDKLEALTASETTTRSVLYPLGMILISFGFTAYILTLIPLTRFVLGILGWFLLLFEAVLAAPLVSLSLLKTDGEGFAPQQFQSAMTMLLGVIIRPMLMVFGLVLGLIAFNAIIQIANLLFVPTVVNLNTTSDSSYLSLGVYIIFYGTLAYTLANSAFKAIDLLPNFVMGWIGQRMESRADDAIMVQQQASGYMQTLAYSARGGLDSWGQKLQAETSWQKANDTYQANLAKGIKDPIQNPSPGQEPYPEMSAMAKQVRTNRQTRQQGSLGKTGGH